MRKVDQRITVVVHTYNARQYLNEVLESVKDFDEILVCDMESTDDTVEIARAHGARVITFPKGNHKVPEPARDFAIHSAENPWVFAVDADELVTEALRDYLYRFVENPNGADGLRIPRVNRYLGKYKYREPESMLRFMRRDKAYWPPTIHSVAQIDGVVERIPIALAKKPGGVHLLHLDDASLRDRITKMNNYTDEELIRRAGKGWDAGALLYRPLWAFVRSYLLRGGWRNGRRGLVEAVMMANYQSVLVTKLMEKRLRK